VHERPPIEGIKYVAFTDPSGGSSDSMTLAIAHLESKVVTVDAIREARPPFSPDAVVHEHAELLKRYRISTVTGDRFGGEWPREKYREYGIGYRVAQKNRSELYLATLPQLNSKCVALLDHKRLVAQLCGLERRTARGGRDIVDHGPGQHDDVANAVAGAIVTALENYEQPMTFGMPVIVTRQDVGAPSPIPPEPNRPAVGNVVGLPPLSQDNGIPSHWLQRNQWEPWR
jgi:hypothetical protein